MEKKDKFTKFLAVAGTILVWIPILFTILTSIVGSIARRRFLFDFLMPAELFFLALAGSLLLLGAAFLAHSKLKLIGFSTMAMLVFLFGGQLIAIVSGLASGAINQSGWIFWLVITLIAFYSFSIILIGIAGILLIKHLNKNYFDRR